MRNKEGKKSSQKTRIHYVHRGLNTHRFLFRTMWKDVFKVLNGAGEPVNLEFFTSKNHFENQRWNKDFWGQSKCEKLHCQQTCTVRNVKGCLSWRKKWCQMEIWTHRKDKKELQMINMWNYIKMSYYYSISLTDNWSLKNLS